MNQSQPDTELANDGDAFDALLNLPDPSGGEVETEEEEEEEEAPPEPAAEDDPDEEWEAGEQTFKVKRSELRAGYMKDADYRRKTAEVAEQRRVIEDASRHLQEKLAWSANHLDVHLASLHQTLVGGQPDPKLIEDDPQEFMRQQAAYNTRAQQFQQALQTRQAITAQQGQVKQRAFAQDVQRENKLLLEVYPELRDEKVRAAEMSNVVKSLSSVGYTQEELNNVTDHRALIVAMKAAKYDQLQAAKDKKAPPVIGKTVKPGAARQASDQSSYVEALAKARKTGRPEDIERVLMLKGS